MTQIKLVIYQVPNIFPTAPTPEGKVVAFYCEATQQLWIMGGSVLDNSIHTLTEGFIRFTEANSRNVVELDAPNRDDAGDRIAKAFLESDLILTIHEFESDYSRPFAA